MKNFIKFSVLVFCLSLGWTAKGQFTLLHTVNELLTPNQGRDVYIPDVFYFAYSYSDNYLEPIKLYNSDLSLRKNISLNLPTNHIAKGLLSYQASAKIWSNDDKVHFFVILEDTVGDEEKCALVNEDGTVVKVFTSCSYDPNIYMIEVDEKKYLYEELSNYDPENERRSHVTNIYSVDIPTATAPQQKKSASYRPYPNPTQQEITLPYMLKSGKDADLIIYNIQGQEIERKRVSGDFDKIRLNVSRYRSGTYIYDCDGVKSKFVVRH